MKIVDANVLLYAVNSASEHHRSSVRWLDAALSGADEEWTAQHLHERRLRPHAKPLRRKRKPKSR